MKAFKNKKLTQKGILWILILLVFLFPQVSHAWIGESMIRWLAENIISYPLKLVFAVCNTLLAVSIGLIDLTVSTKLFDSVFFSPSGMAAINTGWGLVRDFVNMFFILILVFLAIATILRINKFSDKRLLLYVVMAALLVNFSKPISLFLIDTSNLAMGFFIENIRGSNESYSNAFLNNTNFGEIFKKTGESGDNTGILSYWVSQIAASVFSLIMAGMLLLLSISLVIRLVAFWVLIVLSPIAFLGMALPGTFLTQFKDGWFRKMLFWCFYGPVMLFFLWLSLIMITAMSTGIQDSIYESQIRLSEVGINPFSSLIQFVAAIYLLFYGYDLSKSIARSASSSGLGALGSVQNRLTKWGKDPNIRNIATLGLANRVVDAKKGLSENRYVPIIPTKAKRDAKREGRQAVVAGKGGQFRQSEIEKQQKHWQSEGAPSDDQLRVMVRSGKGNESRRQAAAMKLAEDGKMDTQTYRSAVSLMSKNPELAKKLEDKTKKKNIKTVLDHRIQKETEVARKEEKQLDANFKEKKYAEALSSMKMEDIINQEADFHQSEEFAKYMKENTGEKGSGKRFDIETLRKQAAEKMSPEKQAAWRSHGIFNSDTGKANRSNPEDYIT